MPLEMLRKVIHNKTIKYIFLSFIHTSIPELSHSEKQKNPTQENTWAGMALTRIESWGAKPKSLGEGAIGSLEGWGHGSPQASNGPPQEFRFGPSQDSILVNALTAHVFSWVGFIFASHYGKIQELKWA